MESIVYAPITAITIYCNKRRITYFKFDNKYKAYYKIINETAITKNQWLKRCAKVNPTGIDDKANIINIV